MKGYLSIVFTIVFSMSSFAHSPSASTTMLIEKDNHTWVLQISASLTAFQKEIQTHFSETPYNSPEEFQQMVLEHIKNNLEVSFNDGTKITLGQGKVKLGHETRVAFEVFGIPNEIQTVGIKNTSFSDIYKSQSAFIILKNGIEKKFFELNKDNAYGLKLQLAQGKLRQLGEAGVQLTSPPLCSS